MEKIARICWNTYDWKRPSGRMGKSSAKSTYEKNEGFGHEEWILDNTRVMPDGYHYGYLQQLDVRSGKHLGKTYDIHLFTVSPNKQKIYIGCLYNATTVTPEESKEVYLYYKKLHWIEEMKNEISYVGGNVTDFAPKWMFNIKFKFAEAKIYYSNRPIIKYNTLGFRYKLMNKKEDFQYILDEEGHIQMLDTSTIERRSHSGKVIIDPIHKKIQNALGVILNKEYVDISLEKSEIGLTSGQRIDIKGKNKISKEWHYFEVKTCSAKQSIREALGQILEYSHYDHISTRATKLFIVGPEKPDEKDVAYIKKLRDLYGLPIWFRWYSFDENMLYDEI